MKTVKFKDLSIGDEFKCWGDTHLNYNYAVLCKCVKTSETMGQEINGISFLMDGDDAVMISLDNTPLKLKSLP